MSNEFLNEKVFPILDAADAGLIDHLQPEFKGKHYLVNCPACNKRRAWYKPGLPILCNRKNECSEGSAGVSIWTVLAKEGYSNKEIFVKLCDAVGVAPPSDQNWKPSASNLFKKVTTTLFTEDNPIVKAFLLQRGISYSEGVSIGLGLYTTTKEVESELSKLNCNISEAISSGYLPNPQSFAANNAKLMEGRIIGFWRQPDNSNGFWGYAKGATPKYLFKSGLDKSIPYKYQPSRIIYGTEGVFDAESIIRLSFPCCAIGQASISDAQCKHFKNNGTVEFCHVIDTDIAGIKGGIRSIANCYINSIKPSICFTGWMTDDPDNLRQTGSNDQLIHALNNPINGTDFLAMAFSMAMTGSLPGEILNTINKAVKSLSPALQNEYAQATSLLGFNDQTLTQMLYKAALDSENPQDLEKSHIMDIKKILGDLDNG